MSILTTECLQLHRHFVLSRKGIKEEIRSHLFESIIKIKKKNNLKFNSFLNLKENYKLETSDNTDTKKKLTTMHRLIRKARVRNDNMNVTVSKRLLRVKRTLVIPTHVNITAITNSYDVVHS